MATVQLATNAKLWMIGRGDDATSSGAAPSVQAADPVALDGCVECADLNLAKLSFFGGVTGGGSADNKLLSSIELFGWSPIQGGLWMPSLIGRFDGVIGSSKGVNGSIIEDEEYFADTITLVDGDESCRICSGIANRIASLTVDLEGASRLQVVYSGSFLSAEVDSFNFLYSLI